MLTYPVPEELIARLREAHERVKDHPYRANQVGSSKAYEKAFSAMADLFYDAIYTKFVGPKEVGGWHRPGYDNPDHVKDFIAGLGHELNTILYYFQANEATPEHMVLLEKYLIQIHHFIDTGEWNKYFVWYMKHRDMPPNYTVEWEYVPERNAFELTDDYLREHGNRTLSGYLRLAKLESTPPSGLNNECREECRYYYDRIKKLGVTITVDERALKDYMGE